MGRMASLLPVPQHYFVSVDLKKGVPPSISGLDLQHIHSFSTVLLPPNILLLVKGLNDSLPEI